MSVWQLCRGGYVPGEAINIWATIDNQSKVTIKGTRASLTEVRWFSASKTHCTYITRGGGCNFTCI